MVERQMRRGIQQKVKLKLGLNQSEAGILKAKLTEGRRTQNQSLEKSQIRKSQKVLCRLDGKLPYVK